MTKTPDEFAILSEAGHARVELQQCDKAFAEVREGLFSIIENSPIDAVTVREQAYAGLHILKRVQVALQAAVSAGEAVEGNARIRAILAGEDDA
jgi:hypothetical protein